MGMAERPPPAVQAFLSGYASEVMETALRLREMVLSLAPDAIEQVDKAARMMAYGFSQTYRETICVIIPTKEGVNLGFPRGTLLPDPAGILAGDGEVTRHVKVFNPRQAGNPALRALVVASIRQLKP